MHIWMDVSVDSRDTQLVIMPDLNSFSLTETFSRTLTSMRDKKKHAENNGTEKYRPTAPRQLWKYAIAFIAFH